eukprot:TRINITY_DN11591_c0_g1_i1.p1 TRINITY_DN11591_c0_g1~~TRINITY_DN11591_c0_g1_i1.p1  ORF type:complete len:115 (+),score=19.75 TRINITY_DN11591_c0_g1_i1:203-547(+)
MKILEDLFPIMMINATAITVYNNRKQGVRWTVLRSVLVLSWIYTCLSLYGEERVFFNQCKRDDGIGLFLRSRFLDEFGNSHKHSAAFMSLDKKYLRELDKESPLEDFYRTSKNR